MKKIFKINPIHKKAFSLLDRESKFGMLFLLIINFLVSFLDLVGIGSVLVFMKIILDAKKQIANKYILEVLNFFGLKIYENQVLFLCFIVLLVFILRFLVFLFLKKKNFKLENKIYLKLRAKILDKYLKAPYKIYLQKNVSQILNVLSVVPNNFKTTYIISLLNLLVNGFTILILGASLLYLYPFETLLLFLFVVLFNTLFKKITAHKIKKFSEENFKNHILEQKSTIEFVYCIKEVKLMQTQKSVFQAIKKYFSNILKNETYIAYVALIPRYALELLFILFVFCYISILIFLKKEPIQIFTQLSVFALVGIRLFPLFSQVIVSFKTFFSSEIFVKELYKELKEENDYQEIEKGHLPAVFTSEIVLKDLRFSYDEKEKYPTLKNLNILIPKGKNIAFVGESGSGKSTLLNIVLNLLKPDEGTVFLDGKTISDYKNYGHLFGYIPQQVFLSDDTITKNIACFLEEEAIDFERVQEVLKQAELYDFIQNLPEKENTIVGDQGIRLSGGQRQRIGIARALYRNPEVLIMDEATAALDNATEFKIMKTFEKLKNKTMIIVAHRLTTIAHCDIIYVMDKGEVVGKGTYEELSQNNIFFKKMLRQ